MAKDFIYFDDRKVLKYITSEEGKKNILPSISIACSPICNMLCPHCIYDAGKKNKEGLTKDKKISLLEEAAELGAKYLQICHEGEPFLDPATLELITKASDFGMKIFMYTNASKINKKIAKILYDNEVCLGVKCDSLNPERFNRMLGSDKAENIYQGIQNLIETGYNKPFERNERLYTKLGLVCTLTSINTENIEEIKDLARYAWNNNIFFGLARLEKGGRAIGKVWDNFKIPDKEKVINLVNWCSEQTGIDYWNAQPTPYCIGVCGLQIADNGNIWITEYGGSCDFTEPDGESYPKKLINLGNVKKNKLRDVVQRLYGFRLATIEFGVLDKKLNQYLETKDKYPNGLQDCGSAKTHTLFVPFYEYVKGILEK